MSYISKKFNSQLLRAYSDIDTLEKHSENLRSINSAHLTSQNQIDKSVFIVGAGPSGLSMAIFLSEMGLKPRIIDKKKKISIHSKALGINPRTLEIFEPYGITKRFLENGRKLYGLNMWKGNQHLYKVDFSKIDHSYPFMLIQSQKESEEILVEEVQSRNIKVEYDTELLSLTQSDDKYSIVTSANNVDIEKTYDHIIAADGGNSTVRQKIGVELTGFRYDAEWELYDIELTTDLVPDEGHIRFFPEGAMIMIRLKENIWRIAGNLTSILNYLPKNTKTGKISWESKFRIHHKLAQQLVSGKIGLIGDAAHQHSPVGARGMNLGIEDAHILSQLIVDDRLHEYHKLRIAYLKSTVNRINNMTMGFAGNTMISRFIRRNMSMFKPLFPLIVPQARKFALGLNK